MSSGELRAKSQESRAKKRAKRLRRKLRRKLSQDNLRASKDVPAVLSIDAAAAVELQAAHGEGHEDKPRTFRGVAYTGGLMRPRGFFRDVVLDLSGTRVARGMRPVLLEHDSAQIVGHSTEITTDGRVTLAGVVSGAGQAAEEVVAAADKGFPWRLSVGASIDTINFIPEGETAQANGKNWKGPVYIVRAATINEISFVTLAGDDRTSATVAAGHEQGGSSMDFKKWLQAKGFDPEQLSDDQQNTLKATFEAEQRLEAAGDNGGTGGENTGGASGTPQPASQPANLTGASGNPSGATGSASADPSGATGSASADPIADMRASAAVEVRRQDEITTLCASYDNPTFRVQDQDVSLRAHAIQEGWDRNRTELEALRASRPQGPAAHTGRTSERAPAALCAALCASMNLPEEVIARDISEQDMQASTGREYRNVTLHMVMDQVIQAAGHHFSGSRKSNDFIRATMRAERELCAGDGYTSLQAAGGFTTVSLTGILGNTANKALIAAYEAVETVHQFITAARNHSDFKSWSRFRLDSEGAFKKIGPDGELQHVGLSEASYTNQVETYGALMALTRQMMINDDLGAFVQIPTLIGRMSAIKREEEVFKLLLSNPSSFFSSGNANLMTGAGTTLQISQLTVAEQKFRDQVDSNGKPILISPTILLAGSVLHVTAKELHDETKVQQTTTADTRGFAANPHAGKYTPVTSPYLNNTAITDSDGAALSGQSDTQWYLFADPAVRAAMGLASLNGNRFPTIESSETDFNTLGMQWRGFDDFGVGMEDPVAAVKSAGA